MSKHISGDTRSFVAKRARHICEYCLIAEEDSYYRHQIEHIISLKHGGSSEPENLALACVDCNRNKGSDVGSVTGSGHFVRFFNPRTDDWLIHFRLENNHLIPLNVIAEATVRILRMNHEDRIMEREVLARLNRYPGETALLLIGKH